MVAGSFYPENSADLASMIDSFIAEIICPDKLPNDKPLRALIMPHAGYIYSGRTAAYVSCVLSGKKYSKIVVMGPDHRVGLKGLAISGVSSYLTPFGKIPLSSDCEKLLTKYNFIKTNPASDASEHSVEVVLPFLQRFTGRFELVPIVCGPCDLAKAVNAIEEIMDDSTLIVASTDLSHYLAYDQAVVRDKKTISMILSLELNKLLREGNRACGIIPVAILMELAGRKGWEPVLLHYENSGDTAGSKNRVVGYAAIAFYQGGNMEKQHHDSTGEYSKKQGELLLKLARKTIADKLGIDHKIFDELKEGLSDPKLNEKRGTFVTLKINGNLRGCIGNLSADKSVVEGVRDNAINAAFRDPRFAPLSRDEFDKIQIEVSILSEPKPLSFDSPDDLLAKLRPGVDGVIIRKGIRGATFLPQVWEQLPDKKVFLSHLCLKAGLPADEWKKPGLQVFTYQVQYFEEP